MLVNFALHPACLQRRALRAALFAGVLAGGVAAVSAQTANPSSATNPFYGSRTAHPATADVLPLSLDDAVRRGLDNNLGLIQTEQGEKIYHGEVSEAMQLFLPTITLEGSAGVDQHNLAALGFGPGVLSEFAKLFGFSSTSGISLITKDTLIDGRIHFRELVSIPYIAGWKAAGAASRSAHFAKMSARGEVVQQVATAYLHAVAAASEIDNAKALESQDQVLLSQAHEAHLAGTVANLDELRARVQLQSQQQMLITEQNAYDKDLILLKREIGIDPGQKIALTDVVPFSELAAETPEEVRTVAYQNRQDYQNLQNQAVEYKGIYSVYRSQRYPTVSVNGYYAVSEISGIGSHGNFLAQGTINVPLFREAQIRGNVETARAQMNSVDAQLADLRNHIDEQVRSALLDVDATSKLVAVSRSNVELATRALSDETDRVSAGVDDNLPLVTAQATLAAAQTNLVESLYQYNVAKLGLARATGIIEQQYRVYLGR
jgi:outer membrane protein TolC